MTTETKAPLPERVDLLLDKLSPYGVRKSSVPTTIDAAYKEHMQALTELRDHIVALEEDNKRLSGALENLLDWANNQCGSSDNDACFGHYDDNALVEAAGILVQADGKAGE